MWNSIIELLGYSYVQRALWASVVVGISCGLLGTFVTLRRMALIGDAISHAILPGVVIGFMFFGHDTMAIFGGAVLAGLVTSLFITWIQRNSITKEDSSIGIVFTGMFSLGVMGISWLSKKEGVHLDMKDFLFGNVLGVSDNDLWLTTCIGIYVLVCIIFFFRYLFIATFDPIMAATMGIAVGLIHYFIMFLLSLTIVASLQSVGVILVVAMLIIPASTAYLLTDKLKYMLLISALAGVLSATSGLLLAIVLDTTPGPCMTLMAIFYFLLALLFSPKRGFLFRQFRIMRKNYVVLQQDILKEIYKQYEREEFDLQVIADKLKINSLLLLWHIKHLKRHALLTGDTHHLKMTDRGRAEAEKLVRAHRLWETYLAAEMGIPENMLHSQAERFEHLFPAQFVDKVASQLDNPKADPHGKPIPE